MEYFMAHDPPSPEITPTIQPGNYHVMAVLHNEMNILSFYGAHVAYAGLFTIYCV